MDKDHFLPNYFSPDEKDTDFEMCFVKIPYVGIHCKKVEMKSTVENEFVLFESAAIRTCQIEMAFNHD